MKAIFANSLEVMLDNWNESEHERSDIGQFSGSGAVRETEPATREPAQIKEKAAQLSAAISKANRRYEGLTPHEITHGHCYEWAEEVVKNLPGAKWKEVDSWKHRGKANIPYHAWAEFQGKAYDAEALSGVTDWKQLPFFKEHSNQEVMPKLKTRTVPARASIKDG